MRPVLPRGGSPAPRAGIRREGAVQKRPVGHVHARREPAEHREPRRGHAACAPSTSAADTAGPRRNVLAEGHQVDAFKDERWSRPIAAGDIVPAVVASLDSPAPANGARLRIGPYTADLAPAGFAWTRRPSAASLFKTGDLIEVQIVAVDAANRTAVGLPRTDAGARGRARRDRQPDWTDQGHGRRLGLRAQQVQSRRAGVPAARVHIQAGRLHGGHRPRLYAGIRHRR